MASSSKGAKNQPHFAESDAPDVAGNPTEVSDYAAEVGNRKVGLSTDRTGLTGSDVWDGLEFLETDNGDRWVHLNGSWGELTTHTDANGWAYQVTTGKRVYVQKFPAWSGQTFAAFNGANSIQARANLSPPSGRSWDEFRLDVSVWPIAYSSNTGSAVIRGYLSNMVGTGQASLIYYNPTGVSIPNTNMSLVGTVTLTEL